MPLTSALVARVRASFQDSFGTAPDLMAQAPGRVNLIGEHTDYNDGFVLPCAIDRSTIVAVSHRTDSQMHVMAADYGVSDAFDGAGVIGHMPQSHWSNYVRGIIATLARRGIRVGGTNIAIGGDVPAGAGLSSSASVSVGVVQALVALHGLDGIDPTSMALIAQESENDFVGCACGIMDQLVSARASRDSALLIDCRSLDVKAIPVPADVTVLIAHSGVQRGLVESAYNERRKQCETAARHFQVAALRDINEEQLRAGRAGLNPVVFQRALHIVTENARTLAAAEALIANDMPTLSQLMAQSHASMRDDFEITVPPVDALVAMIKSVVGEAGGVRMTGGGFGGCVVGLVPNASVADIRRQVDRHYQRPDGAASMVLAVQPARGVTVLEQTH
jgi:galactokinase